MAEHGGAEGPRREADCKAAISSDQRGDAVLTGKEQLREDWREQAVKSEIIPFQEVPDCTRKRWDQEHTIITGRSNVGSFDERCSRSNLCKCHPTKRQAQFAVSAIGPRLSFRSWERWLL